ncbi:LytR/AlgR family response regulator transcription factor [Clostridium tunisiense]|uniref:LytR/AlgR family response regulator transcription factor n=1 Tax=Clostridium tunisiense TaxID=219748 RepID=UPI00031A840A|nr:LytTR family DNA-binding domain-containing protein [Clostridium tunisiense]
MNILIVEDDKLQRENLKRILQEISRDLKIYEAEDKEGALIIGGKVLIDLFYIDIHLKNSSGITLAKELRKDCKYELSWIIFITTHMGYMIDAFKQLHCYDYIEKPYNKEKIIELTNKFIRNRKDIKKINKKYVVFDIEQRLSMKIYIEEIFFIEIRIKTCTIHTKNGAFKISGMRLKEILEKINCDYIIQCHKSFIVNTKEIKKIEKVGSKSWEIGFQGYDKKALISYNFKDQVFKIFKEKYNNFVY